MASTRAARCRPRSLDEQRGSSSANSRRCSNGALLRWLLKQPASLFGLGIPPAQYDALRGAHADGMADVVDERLERLACGFPIERQLLRLAGVRPPLRHERPTAPLPPYLELRNFQTMRDARAGRGRRAQHRSPIICARSRPRSLDRYVLLDAQDWMDDGELNALWHEITRTARPGARVIFRTGGRDDDPARAACAESLLTQWHYERATSRRVHARDRSAIYGGFHLYVKGRLIMTALASDAERMDRIYRFQRHIYDRTRTHYLLGRKHLIAGSPPSAAACSRSAAARRGT